MKEHPILFNGDMVRAILSGQKTQTRRFMKVQPESNEFGLRCITESSTPRDEGKYFWSISDATGIKRRSDLFSCPFGKVGDRLWVRESAMVIGIGDKEIKVKYMADESESVVSFPDRLKPVQVGKLLSNGCYREACRIILEITNIRVGRLNDISDKDAVSEGMFFTDYGLNKFGQKSHGWFWKKSESADECLVTPTFAYGNLMNILYGESTWDENKWVWVIEFKRVEQ